MFTSVGAAAVLRLSDLATDGTTYNLTMFGTLDGAGDRTSVWTVDGIAQDLLVNNNDTNVVQFSNILPDSNGWIDIAYTEAEDQPSLWSVFEIQINSSAIVPEPGTLALLAGGSAMCAFGAYRKRRSR